MKLKFLLVLSIMAFTLNSCSKDDGPKEEANNPPSISNKTVSVSEAIAPGTTVETLTATDADDDTLTFSITGNPGPFKISQDGTITLAEGQSLDFNAANSYSITVSVTDGTDSATATITINVTNVNEAPEIADQGFEASEDSQDGVTLYTLKNVSDPDGDPLTFEISVNDNGLFAINDEGEISLAEGQNLDYETATSHQITVSVSDGQEMVEAIITINVLDEVEAFITKWETTEMNQDISFYTDADYTYDYTIDWGDGTIEVKTNEETPTHQYTAPGTYYVAIKGTFPTIIMSSNPHRHSLMSIEQWGDIAWETFQSSFRGCSNLVENASDAPDLTKVKNMNSMFQQCPSFTGDLNNWDTTNVTSMGLMFHGAAAFNSDLNNWKTGNVLQMKGMFYYATSFNGDISTWDVQKVINMSDMFYNADSFNGDLSNWIVSSVQNMNSMFFSAEAFNSDISNWNTINVTDMGSMFQVTSSFDQDLSDWNVSNVENMASMFNGTSSFDQNLAHWKIGKVTDMGFMLSTSNLSQENYSNTLIGWAGQNPIPQNVALGANGLTYCGTEAVTARNTLLANGWNIQGDAECQ